MEMKVGLWIDHKKAIVVKIMNGEEEIELLKSEVEKQLRRSGGSPLKGHFDDLQVPADTIRQRAFTGNLNTYYDMVIAKIQAADAVLIFGPSEAKEELQKRMEKNRLGKIIAGVEPADRMTTRQVAAKVRQFFADEN